MFIINKILIILLLGSVILLVNCSDVIITALLLGVAYLVTISIFIICGLEFVALATYIIYLGAIVVLFIFVLMMIQVGYQREDLFQNKFYIVEIMTILSVFIVAFLLSDINNNSNILWCLGYCATDNTHSTLLIELGMSLYQVYYWGIVWIAIILMATLIGILIALSYRQRRQYSEE